MTKADDVTENRVTIPTPIVAPLGTELDKPEYVHEVWDTFVKPQQDSGELQSVEDRLLMAILRAVHEGLHRAAPCTSPVCQKATDTPAEGGSDD